MDQIDKDRSGMRMFLFARLELFQVELYWD
jgi:hypothetical protein